MEFISDVLKGILWGLIIYICLIKKPKNILSKKESDEIWEGMFDNLFK